MRVGHGAEGPAQRADLQALDGPRRGHKLSKETMHTSGVVVSTAQLDFGPVRRSSGILPAPAARAHLIFALCSLHIWEYRLDLIAAILVCGVMSFTADFSTLPSKGAQESDFKSNLKASPKSDLAVSLLGC